ncbi:uncharacterized protein [Aegilops tauschii subsp. strangulata]|uniref:uncharacterized protein n=1 Tax=Aegilops tauschii subsp. strangulata TaxID=200361 RepID=UPI003CC8D5AC
MERWFSVSDITFLNLIALTETEGYGSDDYMYWVKEQGIGEEGLLLLDSQDAIEEMIDHSDFIVLNIIVAKANEDRDVESHGGDDGQAGGEEDDGQAGGEEDDDIDKSSSDFEIDRGDYRGITMSYKAWKREFWQEEKEADSGEERVVEKGRPEKLKHVRRAAANPGHTSRAHSQPEIPKFQDFVPEADEYCFPGDVGISDSDGEASRLLSGRKRRLKRKKERKWYDPKLPDAHEQLCKDLCFTNVYEFRKAGNFHVRTLRNFRYHRNEPSRVIVWCKERKNGCEFFMTASKVAHGDTFTIKKCHMDHSCGACGESKKVNEEWVAEVVEDIVRSNVKADVETVLKHTKKKFGMHVPRSLAYRARLMVVDVVQGDHRKQYLRLRDYLQCVLDTNPGSGCIVTTFEDPLNPAPTPSFTDMFYCLQASKDGFLAGCRPFIDGNNNVFPIAFEVVDKEDGPSWAWFVNQLRVCIGTSNQFGNYTIMSNRQKSAGFRAEELKKWVDKASYSFTEHGHKEGMAGLKAACEPAYMWLNGIPKECWARYAMDHVCKTDLVVKNLSEVFNKMILDVRSKRIKTMFEGLRTKLMVKYQGIREKTESCRWEITPHYMEKLEESKKWAKYCEANMAGPNIWQKIKVHPEDYVHPFFKKQMYKTVYQHIIYPVPGPEFWPNTNTPDIEPPVFREKKGKKQTARRKGEFEVPAPNDTSRMGTITCSNCGKQGHMWTLCEDRLKAKFMTRKNNHQVTKPIHL